MFCVLQLACVKPKFECLVCHTNKLPEAFHFFPTACIGCVQVSFETLSTYNLAVTDAML